MKNISKKYKPGTYVGRYLLTQLGTKLPSSLYYHDLDHTMNVWKVSQKYAEWYHLDRHDTDLLEIAAIGHDYGYKISPENHELTGAEMVAMIMAANGYKYKDIALVKNMIMSTRIPQKPITLMDQILADADLDYLGRYDYPRISEKLYGELTELGKISTRDEWLNFQISFLQSHKYHTSFAKIFREPLKTKRLKKLMKQKNQMNSFKVIRRKKVRA